MKSAKIMFLNVRGLYHATFLKFKELLMTRQYDLIIVQETFFLDKNTWLDDPFTAQVSIPITPLPNKRTNGGLAILVHPDNRLRLKVLFNGTHTLTFSYDENLVVTTSYFPPSMSNQTISDFFLNDYNFTSRSSLFLGDFNYRLGQINNDTATTEPYRKGAIEQIANRWHLGWQRPRYEHGAFISSRTDHVFASGQVQCTVDVFPADLHAIVTDHNGLKVVAQYEADEASSIPRPSHRSNIRLNLKRLSIAEKRDELIQSFESFAEEYRLMKLVDDVTTFVYEQRPSLREARHFVTDVFEILDRCLWDSSSCVLGTYNVLKAKLRADTLVDEIQKEKNVSMVGSLFKRINRGEHVRLVGSSSNSDPLHDAHEFFSKLWQDDDGPGTVDEDEIPAYHFRESFHPDTIKKAISGYSNAKSGGPDGYHISLLKVLIGSVTFRNFISGFFNLCLHCGTTPVQWNLALSTLIGKKKNSPSVIESRPISVSSMFRRLFEICLLNMWRSFNVPFLELHPSQAGSRKQYSSYSQILLNDEMSKRGRKLSILLDIQKGFDSVRHKDLMDALKRKGCDGRDLTLIYSLFMDSMKTRLVVNGNLTDEITLTRGIFQGSVLSPLLFEVWIDSLAQELNNYRDDQMDAMPSALFYVDDIMLRPSDMSQAHDLLNICDRWSIRYSARFNVLKCFVLNCIEIVGAKLTLYDAELNSVDEEEYLGVPTTSRGCSWNVLLSKQIVAAQKMVDFLDIKGKSWPEWIKIQLVKTFVLSQFNYCAASVFEWLKRNKSRQEAKNLCSALENLDKKIMKFVYYTNVATPMPLLRYMSLISPLIDQLEEKRHTVLGQLTALSRKNPLLLILNATSDTLLQRPGSYIKSLFTATPTFNEYGRQVSVLPTRLRPTFKNWYRTRLKDKIYEEKGVLHKYVLDKARKSSTAPDSLLYIDNQELRRSAIDWRRNRTFTRLKCFVCSENFSRGHFERCGITTMLLGHGPTGQDFDNWNEEEQLMRRNSLEQHWNYEGHYTLLDSLLNSKQYTKFRTAIDWLDSKLRNR